VEKQRRRKGVGGKVNPSNQRKNLRSTHRKELNSKKTQVHTNSVDQRKKQEANTGEHVRGGTKGQRSHPLREYKSDKRQEN